jgi:hypothetical protein
VYSTPIGVRLKATIRALLKLDEKKVLTDDHKISLFINCIRPSLLFFDSINYLNFEEKEISLIKDPFEFNSPYIFDDKETFAYLKFLGHGIMFSFGKAYLYYKDRSYDFYFKVLNNLCKVKLEIATIWLIIERT